MSPTCHLCPGRAVVRRWGMCLCQSCYAVAALWMLGPARVGYDNRPVTLGDPLDRDLREAAR